MPYEKLDIPPGRDGWIRAYRSGGEGQGRLHTHRELEVNLILKGRGSYLIQGERYAIEPGNLLWLFPGQPHLLVDASEDFHMWVGVFRPRLVRSLTAMAGHETQVLRERDPGAVYVRNLQPDTYRHLVNVFTNLQQVAAGDDSYFNHGLGYLLRSSWDSGLKARPLVSVARVHPAVERALHLLRQGQEGDSLAALAGKAGISYSRLCMLFRSQIGETLSQFRNRMRIQRFQELAISRPHRTLLDAALEAGFGSYAQCHRMVVRLTGEPPRNLR